MNNPASYSTANDLQRDCARDLSYEFIAEIGKMSGRCLDIGSGPGDATVDFILPKLIGTASLVCSDISEEMIKFGKEKYKDNQRLSFIKLDIESPGLPFDLIEQFDHVTSSFCLQWCQDMRQVFENIFNLLRPGGSAFLIFVLKYPTLDVYKDLAAIPRYQPYLKDVDRFIPPFQHTKQPVETLKALIEGVGFEVRHCSMRNRVHAFDSPECLFKLVMAIDPFMQHIPTDLLTEYRKDLAKEITKKNTIVKKNNNEKGEYGALSPYCVFAVYLIKPWTDYTKH